MNKPELNKPQLNRMSATFTQEGNTLGTTEEYEQIDIILETPTGIVGDQHFVVIKTTTGWSMDNICELNELVDWMVNATKKTSVA